MRTICSRSKPLPTGEQFDLTPGSGTELECGAFRLSNDSISNSYMTIGHMRPIVLQAAPDAEDVFRWGSRIDAYILFPANRVNSKPTINGARGMCIKVGDRMDLTLEAIRRHYIGDQSPLTNALYRYREFFPLFGSFERHVDFWLLDDLVDDAYKATFFLPFDDFRRNAPPADVGEYLQLKTATVQFLQGRTDRIGRWSCRLESADAAGHFGFRSRTLSA